MGFEPTRHTAFCSDVPRAALLTALVSFLASACSACRSGTLPSPEEPSKVSVDLSSALGYVTVLSPEDWGPATSKLVIDAKTPITPESARKESFTVTVRAQALERKSVVVEKPRAVLDAYVSDKSGAKVAGPSRYVTVELPFHPADALSNPLFWDPKDELNKWKTPYDFTVISPLLSAPAARFEGRICPQADAFALDKFVSDGVALSYAWFKPAATGPRPLIVWLHGAGEGGTDAYIALLGNKVTALAAAGIQSRFKGAYVLIPQSPLVWMTHGGKRYDINRRHRESLFSAPVEALIRRFVASHPDVDRKRIYLGGCSNGGYMTVNLVLRNPGFFAAAFPVSEAYPDAWLSDVDIARLAGERLWFVGSTKDAVVEPEDHMLATADRIRKAGGKDVRVSCFGAITDWTGKYKDGRQAPYEYIGHWSWIRALNDECEDGGATLMQWLAAQSR